MLKDLRRWADTIVVFDAAAFSTLWYYSRDDEKLDDDTDESNSARKIDRIGSDEESSEPSSR